MSEHTNYETPYFAQFEHADGSWYLLWVTHTRPRTERGHPWHVHASFDKHGALQPVASSGDPSLAPYGMHNWDFDAEDEAIRAFEERMHARLDHGYQIARSRLPEKHTG
jgi:hypothetical protein